MKSRPILFSTPMVQAILCGRKTQTRRIALRGFDEANPNHPPHSPFLRRDGYWQWLTGRADVAYEHNSKKCPYGIPGDVLWVRETWFNNAAFGAPLYVYRADGEFDDQFPRHKEGGVGPFKWKPSIFMPREACRIKLLIKDVRIERLQDISEEDAKAEGIYSEWDGSAYWYKNYESNLLIRQNPKKSFQSLWQSINGPESWNENPWVWVVEFETI